MGIGVDPGERCESAAEGAALGLLGLMSGISEDYWCAGWVHGLEFDLWDAAMNAADHRFKVTARQANLLRLLSEECDGCWYWKEDRDDNPQFVSLSE
jgi:hypothetical protein